MMERSTCRQPSPDDVEYLTVKEYAARFKLNPQTVYHAIKTGRLRHPVEKTIGRTIRICVPRINNTTKA